MYFQTDLVWHQALGSILAKIWFKREKRFIVCNLAFTTFVFGRLVPSMHMHSHWSLLAVLSPCWAQETITLHLSYRGARVTVRNIPAGIVPNWQFYRKKDNYQIDLPSVNEKICISKPQSQGSRRWQTVKVWALNKAKLIHNSTATIPYRSSPAPNMI